jgi:hypothetical protein
MESIFISIAACKEEFLAQTVKSAIANALNPELLYFGICNMVVDEEDYLSDPIFELNNINYVEIKYKEPLGTGIGRLLSSLMSDKDHKYFLQVDAHTIFTKGWDLLLKTYYQNLLNIYDKPIISTSPSWWAENDNKEVMLFDNPEEIIDPYDFVKYHENCTLEFRSNKSASNASMNDDGNDAFSTYGFVEGSEAKWEQDEMFKEHGLIHAAFMFFNYSFRSELLSDPYNPWDGDQTNISFRAGTRGYRMFSIRESCIWSKNKIRENKLISNYDWRNCERGNLFTYYTKKANQHQIDMFSGNYLGYWGAPTKESIASYESFMGFKFIDKFIKKDK